MSKAPPIVLTSFLLSIILLEFVILPWMEDNGQRAGARWNEENKKLFQMNHLRNFANGQNAVWQSALHQPRKEAGHPRILVVGDSFVWGDGYANANDLWWRLLERDLHRAGYEDAEVCAVGLCGLTMQNALAPAQKAIEELRPDIIVWSYIPNNANEQLSERPSRSRLNDFTKHFRILLPQLCFLAQSKLADPIEELLSIYLGAPRNTIEWEKQLLKGKNFEELKGTMCRLGDLFTVYDIPSVVVLLPTIPIDGYNQDCFKPITKFLSLIRVNVLDLAPGYLEWVEHEQTKILKQSNRFPNYRPLWINPANTHPSTTLGHYYSTLVARHVTRNYPELFTQLKPKNHEASEEILFNDCMPPHLLTRFQKTNDAYELVIPFDEHQLFLPIRKPFVQLNLKEAKDISAIELRGQNLLGAHIFLSTENETFERDIGELVDLGPMQMTTRKSKEACLRWKVELNKAVNTIKIARARFASPTESRQVEIRVFIKERNKASIR